jgi:hypothetical protein
LHCIIDNIRPASDWSNLANQRPGYKMLPSSILVEIFSMQTMSRKASFPTRYKTCLEALDSKTTRLDTIESTERRIDLYMSKKNLLDLQYWRENQVIPRTCTPPLPTEETVQELPKLPEPVSARRHKEVNHSEEIDAFTRRVNDARHQQHGKLLKRSLEKQL